MPKTIDEVKQAILDQAFNDMSFKTERIESLIRAYCALDSQQKYTCSVRPES